MSLRTFNFFQAQPETDITLADELIDAIFSELTLEELMQAEFVCKRLNAVANTDVAWQRLFKKYFYMDITGPHCKEKFILFFTCLKAFKELPKALFIFDPAPGRDLALQDFMTKSKKSESDEIWLTFLQAISDLYFAELYRKVIGKISQKKYEKKVACSLSLLQRSCDLNNPFALQRLAEIEVAASRFEPAEVLLTRAHTLGSLDATYELAMFYFKRYRKFKPHQTAVSLHHDLIFQAAKRGSSKAALHIGSTMYLFGPSSPIHIPFGDQDWKTFNLFLKMATENKNKDVDIKAFIGTYAPTLKKFAEQGSALAAMFLDDVYQYAPGLRGQTNYKDLHTQLYASALPARLERACYWLEEAAKDPKQKPVAERLLKLVKEAIEISAKPENSKNSSSPRAFGGDLPMQKHASIKAMK